MPKLTNNDIKLVQLTRAKKDGDQPSIKFKINDLAAVTSFIRNPANGFLWGRKEDISTCRLSASIEGDTLTICRSVGQNTWPESANSTLANAVLTLF